MKIWKVLSLLLFVTVLTACESSPDEKADEEKQEEAKEKKAELAAKAADTFVHHLICPQVAILRELSTTRDYGNEKIDTTQLVTAATMKNIEGTCSYHRADDDFGIDIVFSLNFLAYKGPQFKDRDITIPYFVAIVSPNQVILNKNQLNVSFHFKSNDTTSEQQEDLHIFIPLTKDQLAAGPNYRVLTGFQLTEAQLTEERNRVKAEDAAQQKLDYSTQQKFGH